MTDAIDTPPRRARRELHSTDTAPPQMPDVELPGDGPIDRVPDIVVAERAVLDKDYQAALAFAEEPVTILLQPSSEENAPMFQECWVNGRGIEFLTDDGKWRVNWPGVAPGYAPVDVAFTTKRKYVEVLCRKRQDRVKTVHEELGQVANPTNRVTRQTVAMAPVSLIADRNPKGGEWFARLMRS